MVYRPEWHLALIGHTHRRLHKTAESPVKSLRKPPAEFASDACNDKNANSTASKGQKKPAGNFAQRAERLLDICP